MSKRKYDPDVSEFAGDDRDGLVVHCWQLPDNRQRMFEVSQRSTEAIDAIYQQWDGSPRAGLILGSGLGQLCDAIDVEATIDYATVPHFARTTAMGHVGRILCGNLESVPVIAMNGRSHFYEGHSMEQVTFPTRVMAAMGINLLIVTNAAGGLNRQYECGDVMVIEDHINLMFSNPLRGINDDSLGPRFPDLSQPYDFELIDRALAVAAQQQVAAHRGVYAAVAGPNYETRAEYRFLHRLGADVVGMSTVPEVIVAAHAGIRVLGLSSVTNVCNPDSLERADGEAVLAASRQAEPSVRKIVCGILQEEAGQLASE